MKINNTQLMPSCGICNASTAAVKIEQRTTKGMNELRVCVRGSNVVADSADRQI